MDVGLTTLFSTRAFALEEISSSHASISELADVEVAGVGSQEVPVRSELLPTELFPRFLPNKFLERPRCFEDVGELLGAKGETGSSGIVAIAGVGAVVTGESEDVGAGA